MPFPACNQPWSYWSAEVASETGRVYSPYTTHLTSRFLLLQNHQVLIRVIIFHPYPVIFFEPEPSFWCDLSESMLSTFSCTKSLLMEFVFWAASANAALNFSGFPLQEWSGICALPQKPAAKKTRIVTILRIGCQMWSFIQRHNMVAPFFNFLYKGCATLKGNFTGIVKQKNGTGF